MTGDNHDVEGSLLSHQARLNNLVSRQSSWRDAWSEALEEASLLGGLSVGLSGFSLLPLSHPAPHILGYPPAELLGAGEPEPLPEEDEASGLEAYKQELGKLLRLALPLSVTNLCAYLLGIVTIAFVGRLGELQLSVVILGVSIYNVTGSSILTGFCAALETFCGQAYGAGNYKLVGVVLQRAMLLTCLLVAGVWSLWSQADWLLRTLGQDHTISAGAARFLHLALPALLCSGLFEAFKRYLMTQGEVRPATVATFAALALSPLANWLLIFKLRLGVSGAALAMDVVQGAMALSLGLYILVRSIRHRGEPNSTWHGWSWGALKGWGSYLGFALPSVIMICAEAWAFQAVIIMSGWLPNPEVSVAVIGVAINISSLVYYTAVGLAMALSVRVAHSLGAGQPRSAWRAVCAALLCVLCLEALAVALVLAARHALPTLFTDVPSVVEGTAALLPVLALGLPGDGVNGCLQGLLRGAGKQGLGVATNICSYWLFGLPLAATFAFKLRGGLAGIWWGLVAVNTVQGAAMLVIAMRLDYEKLSERAVDMFRQASMLQAPSACPGLRQGRQRASGRVAGGQRSGLLEPLLSDSALLGNSLLLDDSEQQENGGEAVLQQGAEWGSPGGGGAGIVGAEAGLRPSPFSGGNAAAGNVAAD